MYESYFGFSTSPFSLLPDPGFLYLGEGHSTALSTLEYGLLNNAGFTVITGDIGCGKTTLIRYLLNELGDEVDVGLISNTGPMENLLHWVLWAFGIDYEGSDSETELYQRFVDFLVQNYASGKRCILIVDEAQNVPDTGLEELRLLSNINADSDLILQMILVGQPSLRTTLRSPRLEQFAQRITVHHHLVPLDQDETCAYIWHRLDVAAGDASLFSRETCAAVYKYSAGIPRLINQVCDTALAYAFGDQVTTVSPELVDAVVSDRRSAGIPVRGNAAGVAASPTTRAQQPPVLGKPSVPPSKLREQSDPTPGASQHEAAELPSEIAETSEEPDFRELFSDLRKA